MMPGSILLVEDNIDDEYLATRVLRKAGIDEIRVARNGQEALDMLLNPGLPLPEMVILDLRLPGIDGLKVFTELRCQKRTMTLPVLILSSTDDPKDRDRCISLGAIAFLTKPMQLGIFQQLF